MRPVTDVRGFRRELHVEIAEHRVTGELVDDFHHFRAEFDVTPGHVVAARGAALRYPWGTCPGAIGGLAEFLGPVEGGSARAVATRTTRLRHCTHLRDVAALSLARWARGGASTVYSIFVADPVTGPTHASIARDGHGLVEWQIEGLCIRSPELWAGCSLGRGAAFAERLAPELGDEQIEAILLLQRSCLIALGRQYDLDTCRHATDVPGAPTGACFTYGRTVAPEATRVPGATLDFAADADLRALSRAWVARHGPARG